MGIKDVSRQDGLIAPALRCIKHSRGYLAPAEEL